MRAVPDPYPHTSGETLFQQFLQGAAEYVDSLEAKTSVHPQAETILAETQKETARPVVVMAVGSLL